MEEDIIQKYTETVIKQIVKKDDEYTREMIKEYVRAKYPNEKVRIDFYDEETIDKIIDLGINALNSEKTVHTCLHCGNDTPLYCENCYQELISKNAELQLEIEELKQDNSKQWKERCKLSFEVDDSIPKQKVRDKIEELKAKYNLGDDYWQYDYDVDMNTIDILEELLK